MIRKLWDWFIKCPFEFSMEWHSGQVADSLDYSNIPDTVSPAKVYNSSLLLSQYCSKEGWEYIEMYDSLNRLCKKARMVNNWVNTNSASSRADLFSCFIKYLASKAPSYTWNPEKQMAFWWWIQIKIKSQQSNVKRMPKCHRSLLDTYTVN